MTLCGLPAAMDSAPTPNATSPIELWNQLNPARLGGGADLDSICKEIDAEDVEATTPRG